MIIIIMIIIIIGKDASGRGTNLLRVFLLLFLYLSKIRKVVKNGQKGVKGSTPNNKPFLF